MNRNLIKNEERKMLQDVVATEIKKENFIKEIMDGLGEDIKKEPNKIHVEKKISFWKRILKSFQWEN